MHSYPAERQGWVHPLGPLEQPPSHSTCWRAEEFQINSKGKGRINTECTVRNQVAAPAVVHQIENNLVQHLLKQGCADPEVFDSLWGEAGQPWHPAKTVLTLEALTAPALGGWSKRKKSAC